MRAKEFIPASKPRNFVAKNQQTAGAGAHRDKKKEQKQGYEKHKGKGVSEGGDVFYNAGETANKKPVGKGTTVKNKITGIVGKAYSWSVVKGVPYLYVKGDDDRYQSPAKDWLVLDEQGVAEGIRVVDQDYDLDQVILTLDIEGRRASFTYTDYDENFENAERRDVFDQLQEKSWYKDLDHPTKMEILDAAYKAIRGEEPSEYKPAVDDEPLDIDEGYGTKEFEVDGYTYMTDLDREEDNQKIWHMIKTPDGKTVNVDFTPYEYMTKDDVEFYIKLGMPKRQGVGPLDSEQLQKMAQIKGVAMLDPKMARAGM